MDGLKKLNSGHYFLIAIFMYGISLLMPAIIFEDMPKIDCGYQVLLYGWLGLLILIPNWIANPLFIISLFLSIKYTKFSKNVIAFTFLIAIAALLNDKLPTDEGGQLHAFHFGIGYYVWLASFAVANWACYLRELKNNDLTNKME